ncbi:cation:dicarboxylase symporter family transporter [Cryobacterium breve]|uniref:Cation:dicarboxylase symporter family transporter n=1 Tax=Cryobacterium breve TaxID=1259258 RepID=A0ABY7NG33_9MICO|nr:MULTISPECIES: cation:dicarboxylase symporter family transporter [Cryobacterium]MDY7544382.1 cation:dicarboxylase symporter family transporter [Cryobacterium sp. 5B3]MEA9998783.1 cation:dicarboxylase symporter family transporter [Cryobacterium sp. RTS3]MEB0266259.1 cation:dicarboxylase symporter family transporter [Cryobacterium sp. 10I5]MEB0274158.1 cation:dicarboxylase symporter family transporter [Cryobacterium sp. 5B3]WBM80707.1 cation:dicarboxylase symporter family transporter [Cryobact
MAALRATRPVRPAKRIDKSHYLYIAVVVAVVLGITVGLLFGGKDGFAVSLKPLGDVFIALIKMMISPIIFCTIVIGIGSIAKAATVGRIGGLALGYFLVMSTFALGIGLLVGNLIHPGAGLDLKAAAAYVPPAAADSQGFFLGIIPTTLFSSVTSGNILQTLFVALIAGFALQKMGRAGKPILEAIANVQALVFRILIMVMWLAPIGAFGAIAAVVGATGFQAVVSLFTLMGAFYLTCILFIVVILGGLLKISTGVSIFKLMRYLGREYLLIFSTSSSEAALPRLIAKMEHLGVSKPVVGVTVPTGYSFNLDGTAIYLTMASLFIATAMGQPLALGEQIGLLVFMIIASKGAAGVSGAGLATLAAGLQAHAPQLLGGVGFIVGIDRFMSEARALTNFTGNAVATVLIGSWTREIDRAQVDRVLDRLEPFDETTMMAHTVDPTPAEQSVAAERAAQSAVLEDARH